MSRFPGQNGRPLFASATTYDALEVEEGEESEEEQSTEFQETAISDSLSQDPPKPTKSAIKKAQRLARTELRKQNRQTKAPTPVPVVPQASVNERDTNNVEILTADAEPSPLLPKPALPTPLPASQESVTLHHNGDNHDAVKVAHETTQQTDSNLLHAVQSEKIGPSQHSTSQTSIPANANKLSSTPPNSELPSSEQDPEMVKARQNAMTRTLWTFIMIFGFIGLLLLGHAYMILLVMLCQTLVYREVTALFSLRSKTSAETQPIQAKDPWSKTLNWYFFAVTNYFLYGESIIYYFKHVVFADAQLLPFATNHRMISFTLYTIGFMGFVMSLKKGYLKQQFGLFCWVHMSLLLIVVSSHFVMNNILEGLIWFFIPASLVICNDVFAYICGKSIGRTPLIKLSPKKTVEGFTGAFFITIIFAVLWGTYFMRYAYMICPVHDLGVHAWSSIQCTPNPVFVWRSWTIWRPLATVLSTLLGRNVQSIPYVPYQLHLLVLACFASLVAPFGGFFASGFKRAFDIKDFGHSIPGHGGMTDRMDCQFLMGVFTYVYHSSLIREHHVTVGSILQTIVSALTVDEQLELLHDLRRYLEKQGVPVL